MNITINEALLATHQAVDVKFVERNQKCYFVFEFKDYFSKEAALESTGVWRVHCEKHKEQSQIHIWNCQKMQGFDAEAKRIWMRTLSKYDSQVEGIVLISDNIFIRGAARLMSKFTKLNLEIYAGSTSDVIRILEKMDVE